MRILLRSAPTTLVGLLLAASAAGSAMSPAWVERWRSDLDFALEAIAEAHPAPFHSVPSAQLETELASLAASLPQLDHHQAVVELARIVALVGDGHTRLTLPLAAGSGFVQGHTGTAPVADPALELRTLPVRLALDPAGPWVVATTPGHRHLLGGRLTMVDGVPVARVMAAVEPTIRRDNAMQVSHHLPRHLVIPEILHWTGLTRRPDRVRFTVEHGSGERSEAVLHPLPAGDPVAWIDAAREAGATPPPSLADADHPFQIRFLAPEGAVYLRLDEVDDQPDETLRQLGERMERMVAERSAELLVIDLRHNRGGDQSLALPLLHSVLASGLDEGGRLFVLVGRATFSAAMNLALHLERHTQALFVGEPTGARPNSYGDARKIRLPETGLTLRVSTLYWQWHPRDERPWIAPDIPAAVTADDYLAGRDPVLEAALALAPARLEGRSAEVTGEWTGTVVPKVPDPPSRLVIERGEGLAGRLTEPGLGADGTAVEDLTADGRDIAFALPLGEHGVLRFQGRIAGNWMVGDWMVGEAELGSLRYPFALRRRGAAR